MVKHFLNIVLLSVLAGPSPAAEMPAFPFTLPWDDAGATITDMRSLNHRPAGKYGFVRVKDGHLATNSGRIRFLGVNICMDACFPEHSDAEKVAARMAKFGINCVRFHHMDYGPAPLGILQSDQRTLDPTQMDRLDYFIAQLKKNGVYVDLNLHVSRVYPGQPVWDKMPSFHKGVDNFAPEMLRLQREYARDLLTHLNPYTEKRYNADPAVAFVEINNENGLLQIWGNGELDAMPEGPANELKRQWNAWLKAKYLTPAGLAKAWKTTGVPLGAEMLNGRAWNLEQHEKAAAVLGNGTGPDGQPSSVIRVTRRGEQGWHVQFNRGGLKVSAGKPYTFRFRARAGEPGTIQVNSMQAHAPWTNLWSDTIDVGTEWKEYTLVFHPSGSDDNARIGFGDMGSRECTYEFAAMSLRPGGTTDIVRNAVNGNVPWFPRKGFSSLPPTVRVDWVRFLWDTEVRYWTGMYRYVRSDLKSPSLIIGTQVSNSPGTIQAKLDVVDNHAYWKHPAFPNRPWDGEDWTVENVPMTGDPYGGTLSNLAWRRALGKPYVVTEYNHPAPNSYGAEMMPLLCSVAALQDWDGVFAFDYNSNRSSWASGRIGGFFSIANHPAKMATFPASAALFLRGDVSPAAAVTKLPVTVQGSQSQIAASGSYNAWNVPVGVDPLDAFRVRCGWSGTAGPLPRVETIGTVWPVRSRTGELAWGATSTIDTPLSKAVVGTLPSQGVELGGVNITGNGDWAVVTLTLLSGRSFSGPCRILVTAVADARNTGMQWKDATRNSVGSRWGSAPVLLDGVFAKLALPVPPEKVKVWALDERGARGRELSVGGAGKTSVVTLDGSEKTLWYEINVQ